MDETLRTTNKLADEFYEKFHNKYRVQNHHIRFLNMMKGDRILDCGCGTGRDANLFAEKGYNVTGIDISERMLEFAEYSGKAVFKLMDMKKITFKPNSFNGIWCCASLYHLKKEDVSRVLLGFNKLLKEKGLLFLSIKEGEGEKYVAREIFHGMRKFYAFYTPDEITNLLLENGFLIEHFDTELKEDNIWLNIYSRKK